MLVTLVQKQLVVNPKTNYDLPCALVEDTVALYHVMVEDTLVHFSVC